MIRWRMICWSQFSFSSFFLLLFLASCAQCRSLKCPDGKPCSDRPPVVLSKLMHLQSQVFIHHSCRFWCLVLFTVDLFVSAARDRTGRGYNVACSIVLCFYIYPRLQNAWVTLLKSSQHVSVSIMISNVCMKCAAVLVLSLVLLWVCVKIHVTWEEAHSHCCYTITILNFFI